MGTASSSLFSYWRSDPAKQSTSSETSGFGDQPTCDPKNLNGHSNESGDEDAQDQDGGNLGENNLNGDKETDKELDDSSSRLGINKKKHHDQEHCVSSVNGGDEDSEAVKEPETDYKNGQNGDGNVDENFSEAMENGTNADSGPIIVLNDIALSQEALSQLPGSRITYQSEFGQGKPAVYTEHGKVTMGTHQRQSQLTMESRKRDHSADSDRSTPSYQINYFNNNATYSKRQKSSETDSVSSSRSDRASAEIDQITPKVAKSRKRRAKPSKKYLS